MPGMNETTGATLTEREHILQSVATLIRTPVGSRVHRRTYGSVAPHLVDQPLNTATALRLYSAVAASIICFATSNERIYGLDLRGGTLVQMSVKKPLETNDVRERLLKNFSDGIEVQRVINRQAKNREFSIRIAQENGIREKIQQLFSTELADKAFGKIEKIALFIPMDVAFL